MLTCRFCFRMFPALMNFGPQTVARSMEDPTVCEACYKVSTDLNALMRDQAAAQVDAKDDLSAFVSTFTPDQREIAGLLPQQTTPPPAVQDDEIEVTPAGGKHSAIGRAFHHLDPELMLALAGVLYTGGKKYGRDNWKSISVEDHLNHAFNHVYLFQTNREAEDLEHAILRLMFAWSVENEGGTYNATS